MNHSELRLEETSSPKGSESLEFTSCGDRVAIFKAEINRYWYVKGYGISAEECGIKIIRHDHIE